MEIEIYTKAIFPCPLNTGKKTKLVAEYVSRGRRASIAHALRKYFHEVPTKNGSSLIVSMAQNPMGIRTQFRPAPVTCFKFHGGTLERNNQPAISAKSCSVYRDG